MTPWLGCTDSFALNWWDDHIGTVVYEASSDLPLTICGVSPKNNIVILLNDLGELVKVPVRTRLLKSRRD